MALAAPRRRTTRTATKPLDLGAILHRIAMLCPQKIPAFRALALEVLSQHEREQLKAFPHDFTSEKS